MDKNGGVRYAHITQQNKLRDLKQFYDPRYENLDEEPVNYNSRWLWPDGEYRDVQYKPDDPEVAGYIPRTDATPQTLKIRDLKPDEIAKHPIFAQGGLQTIAQIANSLSQSRTLTAHEYDVVTTRLQAITTALRQP